MINSKKESKSGFTLVELLVVISIIGVLAGVVITLIDPLKWQRRSRDATRKEDLAVVQGALERWYSDNNQYPGRGKVNFNGEEFEDENNLDDDTDDVIYLKSMPQDPSDSDDYEFHYYVDDSQQNYCLCGNMEESKSTEGTSDCHGNYRRLTPEEDLFCLENPF